MDELEYITKDALMMCDQGGAPDFFKPTFNTHIKIHGCVAATNMDGLPLANIPSFKVCKITKGPCTPATARMTWKGTWPVKVKGIETLIGRSTCQCNVGGKIEFMTSGQIPLPPEAQEEVDALQKQADKELNDAGHGDSVGETGFAEGMIPVWGSGRDLINDIQTGDGWGAVGNAGFLVWDAASIVAGVFSFGSGTAGMQGIKAAIKGGIKTAGKAISKKGLQGLGKSAFRALKKEALQSTMKKTMSKLGLKAATACFSGDTLIHTKDGLKEIRYVKTDDLVWSFNEKTKEIGLKRVLHTVVNDTDHTIKLYAENEKIETTAIHPFYTTEGWRNASELKDGDKIYNREKKEIKIDKIEIDYSPKRVYNFEVAHWHTFFVGILAWLVHNGSCINWAWNSVKTFGHSFSRHGHSQKNLNKLIGRAASTGTNQGMWKNNDLAADLIKNNWDNLKVGQNIIDIPKGLGQVIKPDGSIVEATQAIIVKNADGATNLIKTAYPI